MRLILEVLRVATVHIPKVTLNFNQFVDQRNKKEKKYIDIEWLIKGIHARSLHIDGLIQDCSISSALAMEILQSCTVPSTLPGRTVLPYYQLPHKEIFQKLYFDVLVQDYGNPIANALELRKSCTKVIDLYC